MSKNQTNQNKFDAKGIAIGRLASQVALVLQGKDQASYQPNLVTNRKIVVFNLAQVKFTGKKLSQKKYHKYSGYPSGIKTKTMEEFFNRDPRMLFEMLIYNMLPKNKLRKKMLKNLQLFNEELK